MMTIKQNYTMYNTKHDYTKNPENSMTFKTLEIIRMGLWLRILREFIGEILLL